MSDDLRLGLIGFGAIGGSVADELRRRPESGVSIVAILRRSPSGPLDVPNVDELIESGCDLVIEAASRRALMDNANHILEAGIDIVALSASALADRAFEETLSTAGPGRLRLSTGAIGGLDIVRAMALSGSLTSVSITSTTVPEAVCDLYPDEDWADGVTTVADGSARDVSNRFPRVTNVAAMLGVATLGLDRTQAQLRVDSSSAKKHHAIDAVAGSTTIRISIENALSDQNVATSLVTAYSVLRGVLDWAGHPMIV